MKNEISNFQAKAKETAESISTFLETLTLKTLRPNGIRIFQISIYGWMLLSLVVLLPAAEQFWGPNALIPSSRPALEGFEATLWNISHLLELPAVASYYSVFLGALAAFLVLGILQIAPRFSSLMILWLSSNLDNKAWVILDGGNNLIHLFLIYLLFINTKRHEHGTFRSSIRNLLNNLAYMAARIQLCLVYVVAGLGKVTGPLWQKGVALYYVLNTEDYSHPIAQDLASQNPMLITLGTYGTILFQILFPILIWNRKARPWLLLAGSFLHLQIAFVMGLFLFGFAMIAAYTSFTSEDRAEKVMGFFGLDNGKIHVAFDHACTNCMRFAKFLKLLDWRQKIAIDSAILPHHPKLKEVPQNLRMKEIAGHLDEQDKTITGFDTIAEALIRVPCFFLLTPIIRLVQFSKLGQWIYRNQIVASQWRSACEAGVCHVQKIT